MAFWKEVQAAINVPQTFDGHTVLVDAGIYSEKVVVNKSVSLIGENKVTTIIDGNETGTVVEIDSNNVSLSGFTIRNRGTHTPHMEGVLVSYSNNSRIWYNNIQNCSEGVELNCCSNITISGNSFCNNDNHIWIGGSTGINIINNAINNTNDYTYISWGVYIVSSNRNVIYGNTITNLGTELMPGIGIRLGYDVSHDIVSENTLMNLSSCGISLSAASNCSILNNRITDCGRGAEDSQLSLGVGNYNQIKGNLIENTTAIPYGLDILHGLKVWESSYNILTENTIINNDRGIGVYFSNSNNIYHNSFFSNSKQVHLESSFNNSWDDGYPSGGNYWSNYTGVDSNHDGIGDTTHVIDANNTDRYPLMNPWTTTETSVQVEGEDYPVVIVSNTTISQMAVNQNTLSFNSSGTTGEKGYINVIFPMVNTTAIEVFIDGNKLTPPPFPAINTNGTHYFIYFEFTLSNHTIAIQFASIVSVGGISLPVSKLELLAPYIGLTLLLAVAVVTVVYVGKRKRNTEISS